MREQVEGVTFRNFRAVARHKGWTVDGLAAEFKYTIENASNFFTRVLREDSSGDVIIPYKSVIAKYLRAVIPLIADGKIRTCACDICGSPVFGRDRIAWPDCKFKLTLGQSGGEAGGSTS